MPRLDVLLYAHDGRGAGHASRAAAIAGALKRLRPELRVAVVTGAPVMETLTVGLDVDWLKLPSYRSSVEQGTSVGVTGHSGFTYPELKMLRRQLLRNLAEVLQPRTLYVDHLPGGKDWELVDVLEWALGRSCTCVLGVRAVLGNVVDLWSGRSRELIQRYYSTVLYFGDLDLYGTSEIAHATLLLGRRLEPMGLVSRAWELEQAGWIRRERSGSGVDCVIGTSWCDTTTLSVFEVVRDAFLGRAELTWECFIGAAVSGAVACEPKQPLHELNCRVRGFGSDWLWALRHARVGLAFAGYNSITDVLATATPSVFFVRDMRDGEQVTHAKVLSERFWDQMRFLDVRSLSEKGLRMAVDAMFMVNRPPVPSDILRGSENAARVLIDTL